ncbi:hypothetical protein SSOG_08607 [Streptomyces himastatinicus ATCC 53653]|uniref:Uncharacterized protein n=1 Tax=Streptomyces himastatinicus ATCC 53653 TaxID=457427 RepID=D9WFD5_9ACTN|nr:hypothetical protein SSOG_08607 [Streptomyces himastatinicus ATCC 53653]
MRALVAEIHETALLSVPQGNRSFTILRERSTHSPRPTAGWAAPRPCTSRHPVAPSCSTARVIRSVISSRVTWALRSLDAYSTAVKAAARRLATAQTRTQRP